MKFHGWTVNGKTISIGKWPDRKSYGLYITEGNTSSMLAYFKTEAQAAIAMDMLDALVKANISE
jgi:hypothetical protein